MRQEALQQWREMKFGLFLHWGIYSIPAKGEWYMYIDRIPVKEYEKLAPQFHPRYFNAEDWVLLAKNAGMRYIVLTAKHHDGFSMFKTAVSPFNVVDGTPFGRDVVAELADACRRHNMKLGLYYSHVREWRHPLAQSYEKQGRDDRFGNYGNYWDYPEESAKDLERYIEEFDKPQLHELLTNYGDILTIWFDTPSHINARQANNLREFVYAHQPNCLVNSRLCYDECVHSDYRSMGDNSIPLFADDTPWETAATSSNAWGYVENSQYLPHTAMLRKLVEIISKGGNLLLNEGPDRDGHIPELAQNELLAVGRWIKKHEEAVYTVKPLALPYVCDWGYAAQNGNTVYLYITDTATETVGLPGLVTPVARCREVGGSELTFTQDDSGVRIRLSAAETDEVRVIALDCTNAIVLKDGIYANDNGVVYLTAQNATLHKRDPYSHTEVTSLGIQRWFSEQDTVSWRFTAPQSGTYTAEFTTAGGGFFQEEDIGHEVTLLIDGKPLELTVEGVVTADEKRVTTVAGLPLTGGEHELILQPRRIVNDHRVGLNFGYIRLQPQ